MSHGLPTTSGQALINPIRATSLCDPIQSSMLIQLINRPATLFEINCISQMSLRWYQWIIGSSAITIIRPHIIHLYIIPLSRSLTGSSPAVPATGNSATVPATGNIIPVVATCDWSTTISRPTSEGRPHKCCASN
jgi:hypothetical protein